MTITSTFILSTESISSNISNHIITTWLPRDYHVITTWCMVTGLSHNKECLCPMMLWSWGYLETLCKYETRPMGLWHRPHVTMTQAPRDCDTGPTWLWVHTSYSGREEVSEMAPSVLGHRFVYHSYSFCNHDFVVGHDEYCGGFNFHKILDKLSFF